VAFGYYTIITFLGYNGQSNATTSLTWAAVS